MTNPKELIGTTENGKAVYVDLEHSHAATHLLASPNLWEVVREALAATVLTDPEATIQRDMGRIIGLQHLVAVTPADKVWYAKRPNRKTFTKYVDDKPPVETSQVVVVVRQQPEAASYELVSAWFGQPTPPFPGDENETPDSRPFWETHALVPSGEPIQPGTRTTERPW